MIAASPFYTGTVRTTWRLFGPRRRALTAGIGLRMLQAVFIGLPITMVVWIVDRIRTDELTAATCWVAVGVTFASLAGQYVTGYLSNRYAWVSTFEAIGEARIRTLRHLQRLPIGSVLSRRSGDVSAVLTSDFEMVSNFAHHALPMLFGAVGLPITVIIGLCFVDLPLAGAVALSITVAVPLFLGANKIFAAQAVRRGDVLATANSRIVEYVNGISVARAYNQTGARMRTFRGAIGDVRAVNDAMAVKLVPLALAAVGVVQLGVPVVVAASSYRWFGGAVDAGVVVIFLVLVLRVYAPLIQVAMQVESLRLADASLQRIGRVMDLAEQQAPARPDRSLEHFDLHLDGVTFGYDGDRPVVEDISLRCPTGTMTAIVGSSGSGKTTILNLMARFWDPDSGTVRIGGADIRELTAEQLFDAVTVVFQDVYLFQGTIRDNIAFGRPEADDAAIEEAARQAQAHDFVVGLPDGYSTRVGEGGAMLSGGERQRVSVARAILKGSPIVLLDEPTSSIDPLNERALQLALAALVRDTTLVVVAHRLSTIRSADHIVVVENVDGGPGRIVEKGTHDVLLGLDRRYATLWRERERERAARWRIRPTSGATRR